MRTRPPSDRIVEALEGISMAIAGSHREVIQARGLTMLQFVVLKLIRRAGRTRPTTLAHDLGVRLSTMSTFVDGLEAAGLVRRQASPGDRRTVLLTLTPRGERVVASLGGAQVEQFRAATRGIPTAQLSTTASVMERVRSNLAASRGPSLGGRPSP